jgi:hypothetical protein
MTTQTIRHVILNQPLRCIAQLVTANKMVKRLSATAHLTSRCLDVYSDCMPPIEGGSPPCRHDLDALRREGAIDIGPDIECWAWEPGPCPTCGGKWSPDERMSGWPRPWLAQPRPSTPVAPLTLF